MDARTVRELDFVLVTYSGLVQGETGPSLEFFNYADRSVQVFGTFGAGGTVVIEGSNDGEHWAALADPQGNPLAFNTAKVEAVLECVRYMRPRVSAGDVTTDLTVLAFGRITK